mgnify:CR=1 FL=1|jgi:hypothetical protein
MLKVRYNPNWHDDPKIRYAIQYKDEQFSELSKVWAERGFELLVHKQDVDPLIDIIQRGEDNRIVDAMTIGVGEWFLFDPMLKDEWFIATDLEFAAAFVAVEEPKDDQDNVQS